MISKIICFHFLSSLLCTFPFRKPTQYLYFQQHLYITAPKSVFLAPALLPKSSPTSHIPISLLAIHVLAIITSFFIIFLFFYNVFYRI